MDINDQLKTTRAASYALTSLTEEQRNAVLRSLADILRTNAKQIVDKNALDLQQMKMIDPMYDRLLLDESRIASMAIDLENVAKLVSPIFTCLDTKIMTNKLKIEKICVPLGVIAVIYESRPNVTIDVFALCFKTGNACVLKGGKEAHNSNTILVQLIQQALTRHRINVDCVCLLGSSREDTLSLLHAKSLIDVCIPRGSQGLIDFVRDNAKIPVIETGAGIVHIYFDVDGDVRKGAPVINNSKTRRVSVCNALDCLLIHEARLADLPALVDLLVEHNVEIYADQKSHEALSATYPPQLLFHARSDDYGREFLSYKLAVKAVANVHQAIQHIMSYTSGHSEAIITENEVVAKLFVQQVDAAAVYVNASTAFTDGAQFGLGAEIGISTQKLHARGPMGLDALTSYKWVVHGNGQVRS